MLLIGDPRIRGGGVLGNGTLKGDFGKKKGEDRGVCQAASRKDLKAESFKFQSKSWGGKVLWADNQKRHKTRGDVRRFVLCVLRNEPLFNLLAQT